MVRYLTLCALLLSAIPARQEDSSPQLLLRSDTTFDVFHSVLHASPKEWAAAFGAQRVSVLSTLRRRPPVAGAVHVWARCLGRHVRAYFFPEPLLDGNHELLPRYSAAVSLVNVSLIQFTVNGALIAPTVLGRAGERWGQGQRSQGALLSLLLPPNASAVVLGVRGWLRTLTVDVKQYCKHEQAAVRVSPPQLVLHNFLQDEPVEPVLDLVAFNAIWHAERYGSLSLVAVQSHQVALLASHAGMKAAAAAGALRIQAKPDYLPQLPGWPMFWQAVSENVALLRAWGTHNTLLFLDPDEFLLTPRRRLPNTEVRHAIVRHGAVVLPRAVFSCARCGVSGENISLAFSTRLRDAHVPEQYGKVGASGTEPRLVYVHFADPAPAALNASTALVAHVRDALGRNLELSAEAEAAKPVSLLEGDDAWSTAAAWLRPQAVA